MGRTTHPADMHPIMRDAQKKAGLLCPSCDGSGTCKTTHGAQQGIRESTCLVCGGTGRKKETR